MCTYVLIGTVGLFLRYIPQKNFWANDMHVKNLNTRGLKGGEKKNLNTDDQIALRESL